MKKLSLSLLVTVILLTSFSISSANIRANRIAIGGVTPYSTIGYAKSIYGKPQRTTTSSDSQDIRYGDFGMVGVRNKTGDPLDKYSIVFVYVSGRNVSHLKTPDGVAVGMSDTVLNSVYGKADKTVLPKYASFNTDYYYYADQVFPNEKNRRSICFSVNQGKITAISCGGYSVHVEADPGVALSQLSPQWRTIYLACGASMGAITYVDATSLRVESKDDSQCTLSGKIFEVTTMYDTDVDKLRERMSEFRYMYDIAKKKMYVYSPGDGAHFKSRYEDECKRSKKKIDTSIDWNSDWKYIAPGVFYGEGAHFASVGETLFGLAYGNRFYDVLREDDYSKIMAARAIIKELEFGCSQLKGGHAT